MTDFQPMYVPTSTTVLSDNPAVTLPLLTVNGWILMQRKVTGGSVSFYQMWVDYRDGFGSPTGSDNYWLGLGKVYRLLQLGNVRLRIEVRFLDCSTAVLPYYRRSQDFLCGVHFLRRQKSHDFFLVITLCYMVIYVICCHQLPFISSAGGGRGAGAIAPEKPMLHQLLGLWSRDGSMFHQLLWL